MKVDILCFDCFRKQAQRAAKVAKATKNEWQEIEKIIEDKLKQLKPEETIPIQFGKFVYDTVKKITNNKDPYYHIKKDSTQRALKLYPFLKSETFNSSYPLLTALKIASSGNIIDFGTNHQFNLEEDINQLKKQEFYINDFDLFLEHLRETPYILYLADNAGETVLDKILIELLPKPVYYAVKEEPIINDATLEDAIDAGINKVATIISSGSAYPGTILEETTPDFQRLFQGTKLIISKGQGNFESLNEVKNSNLFFLLTVKCPVIENILQAPRKSLILKNNG